MDVDGKLYVRARCMLRPAEKGGVFSNQVQTVADLNEVPRRSELLKEKNLLSSKSSKCVPLMTMQLSSGSIGDLTDSTGSKLQKKCRSKMSQTPSDKMLEDFRSSTCSG